MIWTSVMKDSWDKLSFIEERETDRDRDRGDRERVFLVYSIRSK